MKKLTMKCKITASICFFILLFCACIMLVNPNIASAQQYFGVDTKYLSSSIFTMPQTGSTHTKSVEFSDMDLSRTHNMYTATALSEQYSVETYIHSDEGGTGASHFITIGLKDITQPFNPIATNQITLAVNFTQVTVLGGAKLFTPDGITEVGVSGAVTWPNYTFNEIKYKFVVQDNGDIGLYYDHVTISAVPTLKYIIKVSENSSFNITNGHFAITPEKQPAAGAQRKVDYIKVNNINLDLEHDMVYTKPTSVSFSSSLTLYEKHNPTVVSTVKFEAPENAASDDVVFDITYTSNQSGIGTSVSGIVFGMANQTDSRGSLNASSIAVSRASIIVNKGTGSDISPIIADSYAVVASDSGSDATQIYLNGNPIDIRLVAKNNGTLEVYRKYSSYGNLTEPYAVYSNLNVNGYFMFYNYDLGSATEETKVGFSNFKVKTNIEKFSVTVDGGSASVQNAEPGTLISLTATIGEKQKLDYWTVNDQRIVGNTFIMPTVNVIAKAYIKNLPSNNEVTTDSASGVLTFNDVQSNMSSGYYPSLMYKTFLTGAYSVEISSLPEIDGGIWAVISLGLSDYTQGGYALNSDAIAFMPTVGDILTQIERQDSELTTTKIYAVDEQGNKTESVADWAVIKNAIGGGYFTNRNMIIKLEVQLDGTIAIYLGTDSVAVKKIAIAVIENKVSGANANTDFSLTNGYFGLCPNKHSGFNPTEKKLPINYIKVKLADSVAITEKFNTIDTEKWSLLTVAPEQQGCAITVVGGTANSNSAEVGTYITLTANIPIGKKLDKWVLSNTTSGAIITIEDKIFEGSLESIILPDHNKFLMPNYEITATAIYINQSYFIDLPTAESRVGYEIEVQSGSVCPTEFGTSFAFKVILDSTYSNSNPLVKANDIVITRDTNGIYTVANIAQNTTITISEVEINSYAVTLSTGTGYVLAKVGAGANTVVHGQNFIFTLTINQGYTFSVPVVKANGNILSGNNGTYTVVNASQAISVTVEGVEINQYDVIFDIGDGTALGGGALVQRVAYNTAAIAPTITPASGKQFVGWDKTFTEITSNLTITAIYAVDGSHLVRFMDMDKVTVLKNENIVNESLLQKYIPDNKIGYNFINWFADELFTVEFNFGSTITQPTILYGKWDAKSYDVVFNSNGGSLTMPNQAIPFNTSASLNSNIFTKQGHSFLGWAISANGTVIYQDESSYTMLTEGAQLYAVWQKNTYTVTLPTFEGFVAEAVVGSASPVEFLSNYTFKINLNAAYSASALIVKANDVIIVKALNGEYTIASISDNIIVTIEGAVKNSYTVTLVNGTGYTLTKNVNSISPTMHGTNFLFTISIDAAYSNSNYSVKANGFDISDVNGVYTLSNISENITITVQNVTKNSFAVTLPIKTNGYTIKIETGTQTPEHGDSFFFKLIPVAGYTVESATVKVNGITLASQDGVYKISNINQNISIIITSVKKVQFTITVTGGTCSKDTAELDEVLILTASQAPDGKLFDHWLINGEKIEGNTFIVKDKNVTVEAVYKDILSNETPKKNGCKSTVAISYVILILALLALLPILIFKKSRKLS